MGSFNQNIARWNTCNASDKSSMFKGATEFNQNLASWCSVGFQSYMFYGAKSFNQNLCPWVNTDFPSKIRTAKMFDGTGCDDKSDPSENGASAVCQSCS